MTHHNAFVGLLFSAFISGPRSGGYHGLVVTFVKSVLFLYTNAKGLKGLDGAANHRIANQAWCVVPLLVFEEEHKTYDRDMGDASQRRSARSRVETAIGAACATTSWCLKWRTSPSPPLHPSLGTPLFDPDSLGSLCPIEREISSGVLPAARSTQWGKQPSTKKRTPGQLFPPPSNLCDRVLFCRF